MLSLIPTMTSVTASTTAVVYSQPVTFTAVVRPTQLVGLAPPGTVTFYDGGVAIGTTDTVMSPVGNVVFGPPRGPVFAQLIVFVSAATTSLVM